MPLDLYRVRCVREECVAPARQPQLENLVRVFYARLEGTLTSLPCLRRHAHYVHEGGGLVFLELTRSLCVLSATLAVSATSVEERHRFLRLRMQPPIEVGMARAIVRILYHSLKVTGPGHVIDVFRGVFRN